MASTFSTTSTSFASSIFTHYWPEDFVGTNDITGFFERGGTIEEFMCSIHQSRSIDDHEPLDAESNQPPLIPDVVFNTLPPLLRQCVSFFRSDHERDVFLTAALPILAAALPNVLAINVDGWKPISLYMVIAANAGAGKGALRHARVLGEKINERLVETSRQERRQWKLEQQMQKNGEEEPAKRMFFLPANSSARALIDSLSANRGRGVIVESEIVTIAGALAQDWGNFLDILLKSFHAEPLSIDRKGEDSILIPHPAMSMAISGTPTSLRQWIPNTENGLFSRMAFYSFTDHPEWRTQEPREDQTALDAHMSHAADQLNELAMMLEGRTDPLCVYWEKEHWRWHTQTFSAEFARTLSAHDDGGLAATVKRAGVIAFRIACILSVVRAFEKGANLQTMRSVAVTDDDARSGILIAQVYLRHAIAIAEDMPKPRRASGGGGTRGAFLAALPSGEFRRRDYLRVAEEIGISDRTARKYLQVAIKAGLLTEPSYAVYRKVEVGIVEGRANYANCTNRANLGDSESRPRIEQSTSSIVSPVDGWP
ncbi:MAG: DUF3987 domain-containing protein [Candidatus Kapaibacterium sp.]